MKHKFLSLLAILAVVANFSWARTIYLNTTSSSWSSNKNFWVHAWGGTTQDKLMSAVNGGSNLFSVDIDDNQNMVIFIPNGTIGTWTGQSSNISIDANKNCYNYKDSKWEMYEPVPEGTIKGDLLTVLKGEKIMFYGGEQTSWNQEKFNVYPENGGSAVSSGTMSGSYKFGSSSTTYEFAALCAAPNTNYQWGHWESGLKRQATAGCAMIVRGSTTNDELEQKAQSGSNYLYKVTRTCTTTVTTTVASTATVGGTLSYQITSSAGKSVLNKDNSFKTYLYDGTNYKEVTPSDNAIDVSALTAGSGYKVVTVLYDGAIYVVGKTDEFSVQAAAGNHTISYPTAGKWTYGEDKPAQAKEGDPVFFTATPNAGYTLSVSSDEATITAGDNNTYSFTMPDNNVTIAIEAIAQEFGITYPATQSNYTLDGNNPVKGTTDANVSFTATPDDGYQLTVTSEQVASFTKNGNTYSFTMPAKAVTIAIEATEIPKTTFYFWNYGDWTKVNAHMWDGSATGTDWPGIQQTNVIYQSGGHDVYKIEIEQDAHKKVIFNNGSGTQTENLDIPTSGTDICYKGQNGGWMALPEENYAVTISAGDGGSVTQAGTQYVASTAFTVNANATTGYVFKNWTATGGVVIADADEATTTITATAIGTLTANFKQDLTKFAINFSAVGGSATATVNDVAITSGATYTVGESVDVTFSASPEGSNTFYGWFDSDNNKVSDSVSFTAESITSTYTIKAVYAGKFYLKHPWNEGSWTVKEVTYDANTGLYYIYENYGNNGFNYGSDQNNLSWNDNKQTLVDSPAAKDWCYITTTTDGAITVKKVTESYTITASAVAAEGSVTINEAASPVSVLEGKSATLVATAKDGYGFVGWYDNAEKTGDAVSTEATYVLDAVFAAATYYAKFKQETQYTVTIANNIDATTSSTQVGANAKEVTAEAKDGYVFRNWTIEGGIAIVGAATDNPVSITASGAGTLTANYEEKSYIYLQNTLGWEGNIYAYLFKDDVWNGWVKHNGTVAAAGKMENVGDGLFRYEYDGAEASSYISFATKDMISWNDFNGGKAIYRGDFNTCRPVFVPDASQTKDTQNGTDYYNSGYWQTNDTHTGMYFIYTDNWDTDPDREFMREDATATRGMMSIHLAKGPYEFKIKSCGGSYYGNTGTIEDNINLSTEGWTFDADANCKIVASKDGDYTFYFDFVSHKLWVLYPTYYLKHKWQDGEHSWSWKNCDIYNSEDHTYSLYATYEGTGVNYNTKIAEVGDQNYCTVENGKLILVGDPQEGKPARFTYDPATEKVTIENMYFPITMNKYGYATLYHKENLQIPEGVTAKYVTGTSGVLLTYQEVDGGVIPKETGVMLFALDMKNEVMEFEGVAEANEEAPENIMDGSHDAEMVDNSDIHYILTTNNAGQVGMFWPKNTDEGVGEFTNAANKAYVYLPGSTQQNAGVMARKGYLFVEEVNTPTELVDVNANANENGKVLRNGQLIIIRDGIRYNALGEIVK